MLRDHCDLRSWSSHGIMSRGTCSVADEILVDSRLGAGFLKKCNTECVDVTEIQLEYRRTSGICRGVVALTGSMAWDSAPDFVGTSLLRVVLLLVARRLSIVLGCPHMYSTRTSDGGIVASNLLGCRHSSYWVIMQHEMCCVITISDYLGHVLILSGLLSPSYSPIHCLS